MNEHFYAIANALLKLHADRAIHSRPQHATAELNWIANDLLDLAGKANKLGCHDVATVIDRAARHWMNTGKKPHPFPERGNDVQFY